MSSNSPADKAIPTLSSFLTASRLGTHHNEETWQQTWSMFESIVSAFHAPAGREDCQWLCDPEQRSRWQDIQVQPVIIWTLLQLARQLLVTKRTAMRTAIEKRFDEERLAQRSDRNRETRRCVSLAPRDQVRAKAEVRLQYLVRDALAKRRRYWLLRELPLRFADALVILKREMKGWPEYLDDVHDRDYERYGDRLTSFWQEGWTKVRDAVYYM